MKSSGGVVLRRSMAARTAEAWSTWCGAEVDEMTTSAPGRRSGTWSNRTASPPSRSAREQALA
jgi:hypothetical protein